MTIWNGKDRRTMPKNKEKKTMNNNADKEIYDTEHSEQIFIDNFINKQDTVQIFLLGGMRIVGTIIGSDDYTILLKRLKTTTLQMIYKTSITTIQIYEDK
ncbi:MAG: RNA chaperone Hfq [Nitrososphaeraceae archaeon]|nr:RNA chaperone Hfq [Nitrososphaeraceae archaeon]